MPTRLSLLRSIVLLVVLIGAVFIAAPASAAPVEQSCGPNTTYVVQRGDTLFRIALRFGTTYPTLAAANGISNPNRIFYGTTLKIPCANTVQPPVTVLPPTGSTGTYIPPASDSNGALPPVFLNPPFYIPPIYVDCTKLRATSPRDGLAYGDNTFYWDPVPGATGYRVNVYTADVNSGNWLVGSFNASPPATSLVATLGANAGPGLRFSYEVQALVSDIVVCQTPRVTLFREAP